MSIQNEVQPVYTVVAERMPPEIRAGINRFRAAEIVHARHVASGDDSALPELERVQRKIRALRRVERRYQQELNWWDRR